MEENNKMIDESLYSRQLYAIGKDTMKSLINSKVLIIGIDGLSTEICKNIILMGVRTITLADKDNKITEKDLGNYYMSEKDIGKKRSDVLGKRLSELNTNCIINKYSGQITEQIISKYNIVVFIDFKFDDFHYKINEYCRDKNIKTIFTQSRGFFGFIFCDFCNYKTTDSNGEKNKNGLIINYSDKKCVTDKNHDLCSNTQIMINNNLYRIEKIINYREFILDKDITNFIDTCEYYEIKDTLEINYKSLRESISNPEFVSADFSDFDMPSRLHNINVKILSNQYNKLDLEDNFIQKILGAYDGQLVPVNSIIGGIVSHNIISGLSNKYTPINQWLYYECTKICNPNHNFEYKYDKIYTNQVKVIGNELQKKIQDTKIFIVGSGAIGCEHLKNFSMMGIGEQTITDMDTIEKSNLSRQFLFRNTDIGKFKSEIASSKANKMNKNIKINYKINKVGIETENIFDDKFYSNIDIIVNALDNINARNYMDNKALSYQIPLLEAGTLGLKGNTQVIIPDKTESYSSTTDQTDEQIPLCTLKNFPYEISHCIQWAREQFESLFVIPFQTYDKFKKYLNENKLEDQIDKMSINEIQDIYKYLKNIDNPEKVLEEFFNTNYRQNIYDLVTKYPENHITEDGEKFWSGIRRFPHIINYDDNSIECNNLIKSFEQIMKDIYIDTNVSLTQIHNNELLKETNLEIDIDLIKKCIIKIIKETNYKYNQIEFEKDNDDNGHIKFVTACSNLRALNYSIKPLNAFETKGIAGKIIPALASTTSIISGLVAIELYKLINKNVEDFKNTFISLGISFIGSSEPLSCKTNRIGDLDVSIWTKLYFKNMYIIDLINTFKNTYNINIENIMYNNTYIYANYMGEKKKNDILNKDIKYLIGKTDNILLNVGISDEKDNIDVILIEIL